MKICLLLLPVLFLIFVSPASILAQTGQLYGTVVDQQSGEFLTGANVLLVGTSMGASADLEGRFTVRNIPFGRYDIRISLVGYASKLVTGLEIKDEKPVKLDVGIASEAYSAEEVVVTAERVLSTEAALLSERKRAATIGDAISAEQVKRSPDVTSSDALRRVTGISVVDNKFVFVRGVTDRYNTTMLNGVSVTTTDTDADKKSFAFDMVPANLLENTVVTKTATPDLPGDFTGGLVQLNTIDFPAERLLRLTVSSSYNNITNLGSIQKSQSSGSDWTGMDDGTRGFPNPPMSGYELGKALPNNWAQRTEKAPLNGGLNLNFGDVLPLGDNSLGYVGGLSYRNGYLRTQMTSDYYRTGSLILTADGTRDQYSVLWGGLFDVSLKLSGLHKITVKNSFNQTGEDKLSYLTGVDENQQSFRTTVTEWDQRSLYVGKIAGEHLFPALNNIEVRWQGAYISSVADEPDRKTTTYAKNIYYPEDYPYSNGLGQRAWSNLAEYTRNVGVDIVVPVGDVKFKVGGLAESKSRDYAIHFYLAEPDGQGEGGYLLLTQPIDSVFRPENFAPGLLTMSQLDDPRDLYTGDHSLYAGYAMADLPFTLFSENFRLVGGARLENSDIRVNTISPYSTNELYLARLKKTDILPSVNLTYLFNGISNLRLAYSHSVNRPEFREMSSFYFYDYSTYEGVYGNPLLQRALSKNYDVRVEVFPGVGELFAVGYFYKHISGAIEQQLIVSSNPERTWFNSPDGKNYGWEFEARKNLGFLGEYFSNFAVAGNYTRIFSAIKYPLYYQATEYGVREMQGQAPWVINVSFLFREPTLGTTISLLYNAFGKRLDAVGDQRIVDVFEESRGIFDASVQQQISAKFGLKFAIRDWGAGTRKFTTREGNPYRTEYKGTTFGLEASLSL